MKHGLKRLLLAFGLMAFCATPFAVFDPVNDDTDLFRNNPNFPSERPNILIILDNTANWNSAFDNEKTALVSVINGLDDAFNVGWMMYPETGGGNDSIDGAYVRFGMRQMTATNKTALSSMVAAFSKLGDKGNNSTLSLAMHEAYLYFTGSVSRASYGKVKTDYAGNTAGNPLAAPLPGNALPSNASTASYNPAITNACQKSFIIYISNGPANENNSALSTAEGLLTTISGSAPATIAITPNGMQNNWADEYAKFMATADLNGAATGTPTAITYTVEVDPGTQNQDLAMTALMKSMANQGKGKYFAVTSANSGTAIVTALQSIFQEIQAVNSVFAASTLPVSVNVRGTNLNQLYIGVFRPDASDQPRWMGNLKAYQLQKDPTTGAVSTVDAQVPPVGAQNPTTGFITSSAVSFWTSSTLTPTNYWAFRPSTANGVGGASDKPDGDLVEKGGAAQMVRSKYFATGVNDPSNFRPIYTCTNGVGLCAGGSLLSSTPFSTANADIDATSLNLDTHQVSPLTARVDKPVSALTDVRPVSLNNAAGGSVAVSSMSVAAGSGIGITAPSGFSNSSTVNILTMDNGGVTTGGLTCSKSANNVAKVQYPSAHGLGSGITAIVTAATAGSKYTTTGATITIGTEVPPTSFTYPASGLGNPANDTCTVTTSGVLTQVTTSASLGYTGPSQSASVTIVGACASATCPDQYTNNGSAKTVTWTSPTTFQFANTVSPKPTLTSATVTASTSTVEATLASAAPAGTFQAFQTVTIARSGGTGTTPPYEGTYQIQSVTVNGTSQTTKFKYLTSSPITSAASGTFTASQTATTATVTTAVTPSGFSNGQTVTINGVTQVGYDISAVISCTNVAGVCTTNQFTYPVTTGLGTPTGTTITASGGTGTTVTATLANHGFAAGNSITIAGAAQGVHNGTFTVCPTTGCTLSANPTTNTFTYVAASGGAVAPGGAPTVRLTNNPVSYSTVTGHGYGAAAASVPNFSITGAGPAGYNVSNITATVVDANTVSYSVTGLAAGANLGIASGTSILASTPGTLARATSIAHNFVDQSTVTISGASPGAFNGAVTVTVTGADTFTYTIGSAQKDASGSINAAASGSGTSDRDLVINWIRGQDNFEDENSNSSFGDTRSTIHGDVLHSRPAVVNYNRRTDAANINNDVYIFYGGNDGIFRAIKGGFGSSAGDPTPGAEVWGFVAREHFPFLRRLRINSPSISASYKKPYFFDGPIGAYTLDANGNGKIEASATPNPADYTQDKVWLFLTTRRGGRFMYALDVTDPLVPRMLWRKGCPSFSTDTSKIDVATGCDLGWGELGTTTSEPKVISINCTSATYNCGANDPVLMFGAGYDPAVEDIDPAIVTSESATSVTTATGTTNRSMGRGIYVVNARTGDLIWQASGRSGGTDKNALNGGNAPHVYKNVTSMTRAISSDIAVVVGDPTPKPFRAYVGDGRARMWRIDFGDVNPANWTVAQLASVGSTTSAADRRKFMFPPDVIGAFGFDLVIAGTGDREHPFDTAVVNRVYAFKDKRQTNPAFVAGSQVQPVIQHSDTFSYNSSTISGLLDVTNNCIQVPANCGANGAGAPEVAAGGLSASMNTSGALSASGNEGWFISLRAGEKQVGSSLAVGSGAVVFGTNQPSASAGGGACSPNLGVARQYTIDALTGGAFTGTTLSTIYPGGGYLPSPVLVFVGLGGATGTGTNTSGGVPVGGTVSGGQLKIGAGASLGGGNDPTGVVCYGASCMIAPGKQLYSRLRKFWFKEID